MSDHPPEQLDPQVYGSDISNSTDCIRTRKLREFLGTPKSEPKDVKSTTSNQFARPTSIVSQASNDPPGDNQSVHAKVHNIPTVEHNLHRLHLQRLEDACLPVYIPPMAKANLQACDDDFFPLMDKVQEFLASDRQVMLILGDSGSGKSTFNKHLELALLQSYTHGGRIPLLINLPAIERPEKNLITEQLRTYNFSKAQIQELKQHRQFILICDGYDESQLLINLHKTNRLNQQDQWKAKLVISCRSQYLGQDYRDRFAPQGVCYYNRPVLDLFQEAAIVPFSEEQIQDYVKQYVPLKPRTWTTQDYMDRLITIPNLMDLVKNPFLLSLSLEALPEMTEGKLDLLTIKITRVQLYDTFVYHWLDINKRRLQGNVDGLSEKDQVALNDILDTGFVSMGVDYSTRLASAIFEKQEGNPVVQYIPGKHRNSWKAEFFGSDPEIRLLRESSPLTRTGSLFRFLHRSMLEYFLSGAIFKQPDHDYVVAQTIDPYGPLFTRNLLTEPSVIQFLCERVKQHPDVEKQLFAVIEQSKTDPTAATAAANAITILVRAGVRFNGADLRGIRIPGADLSDSQLDSVQLQGADLKNVTFTGSWLRQVDLSGAQMDGVRFGELPFLKEGDTVYVCAYSPDGRMLGVGGSDGVLSIYDTTSWSRAYRQPLDDDVYGECVAFSPNNQQLVRGKNDCTSQLCISLDDVYSATILTGKKRLVPAKNGGPFQPWRLVDDVYVECVAFSPNNQLLVCGKNDGTVQLWNFVNSDTLYTTGHAESVLSVAFSPCGKQLASASMDKTVRLWSSKTGECVFVLKGHTDAVFGVAYSSDGKRIVSGSNRDGTTRVWDSGTGEEVACWNIACEENSALSFSADGQWIAVALLDGEIQITNVFTGELGAVLNSKYEATCMAFSSNGQWIIISSNDKTLRLWDISSRRLISSFSGHAFEISTCVFSPNCSQIASGDYDGYVRLWEVDTSRIILNSDRATSHVFAVTYSPDGRSILSGSHGGGVQQWDSRTGVSTPHPLNMTGNVSSLTLSPDGNQIATGHYHGTIRLWSRHAGTAERTLLGNNYEVNRLAYSPCGHWIVSVSHEQVLLWDLLTNNDPGVIAQRNMSWHNNTYCVAFISSGQILSLDNGTIRLHDPRAQDPCTALIEISNHFKALSLDYSPDYQELAIGAENGAVYLWDLQSDEPCIELKECQGEVCSVAYSPCGNWILSGYSNNYMTLQIWHFTANEDSSWSRVAVVGGCPSTITCLAWNPAEVLEFITGCQDGSVRVWRIASHDDADAEDVTVRMLWGNDVGFLCTSDLSFKDAISLSPMNQKLLVQRGAIGDSLESDGGDGSEGLEIEYSDEEES